MAGLMQKFKDMWTPPEDEYDYEYEDEAMEEEEIITKRDEHADMAYREREAMNKNNVARNNKVVNIHATAQLQVALFKPERFGEETRAVADELIKMHTVVLNLENTNKDVSRRIIDFLSGVAYANGGKIKRVASSTFIITP